jgi:hypothetical protein
MGQTRGSGGCSAQGSVIADTTQKFFPDPKGGAANFSKISDYPERIVFAVAR